MLYSNDLFEYEDVSFGMSTKNLAAEIIARLMEKHISDWKASITDESGRRGYGRNKLGTYKLFKSEYAVEENCKIVLPQKHRSAFATFRCRVAPLRIESGRYENLEVGDRTCLFVVKSKTKNI